jgi:hypothetical protein
MSNEPNKTDGNWIVILVVAIAFGIGISIGLFKHFLYHWIR